MNFIDTWHTYNEWTKTEKLSQAVDLMCKKYSVLEKENIEYKKKINEILVNNSIIINNNNFDDFIKAVDSLLSKYSIIESELNWYKNRIIDLTKNWLYTPEIFKEIIDELEEKSTENKQLLDDNKKKNNLEIRVDELEEENNTLQKKIKKMEDDKIESDKNTKSLLWEIECLSTDYWFNIDFNWETLSDDAMKQIELEKKWRIFNCLDLNQDPLYNKIDSFEKAKNFLFIWDTFNISILKLIYRWLSQYFHPDISALRWDAKMWEEIFKKITDSNEILKKRSL